MIIDKKIIISGNDVEIFCYSEGLMISADSKRDLAGSNSPSVRLRRLIASNSYKWRAEEASKPLKPFFLTLTFKGETLLETSSARHLYGLFMLRLVRWFKKEGFGKPAYVSVMEFTKRGQPHFHVLIFNLPYKENVFKIFSDLWGYGYILFKTAKSSVEFFARYMSKYMSKGRYGYCSSRGLYRPYVLWRPARVDLFCSDFFKGSVPKDLYSQFQYPALNGGEVLYQLWKVKGEFDIMSFLHFYVDETYPALL